MNNSDLADLRAQLRAAAEEQRSAPRGPLRRLRGLLGVEPPAPLLSPPPSYGPRPAPRPRAPVDVDDAPLLLDQILPPPRRSAFGQRSEAGAEPAKAAAPVIVLHPIADDDVAEAIRRVRAPRLRRMEEATETPFLPEDLADHADDQIERVYAGAQLDTLFSGTSGPASAPEPLPVQPTAAESMLLVLEQRLMAEHMELIRVIAGV